ncbi:MAG: plastocyanin/azurin family copper-binding protein [Candidatus Woesearchaeota archaeon]
MKKILTILMLLSMLLMLVACQFKAVPVSTTDNSASKVTETSNAASTPTIGKVSQVVIENSKFMPTDLQVQAGDTVEWVNKDAIENKENTTKNEEDTAEHTVTFESGDFDQKLAVGGKATYTFKEKGTFGYFCSIHPGMRGTIIVS